MDELGLVLDAGVHISFTNAIITLGNARDTSWSSAGLSTSPIKLWNGVPFRYQITVKASPYTSGELHSLPRGFRKVYWKMQAFVLLHEFTHLFHMARGFYRTRNPEVENEIDQFVADIMRTQPGFLPELLRELTLRRNCFVHYDLPAKTAFRAYHRGIVRGLLIQTHRGLDLSNSSHVQLVAAAREMGIRI